MNQTMSKAYFKFYNETELEMKSVLMEFIEENNCKVVEIKSNFPLCSNCVIIFEGDEHDVQFVNHLMLEYIKKVEKLNKLVGNIKLSIIDEDDIDDAIGAIFVKC